MGVGGAANSAFPGDPLDVTSVPAAVAVVDADGLIVRWSRAAQDLVGHPPSEVLRSSVGALLADADPAAVVSRLRRIRRGWQGTVRVRHRAGHTVRLAVRVAPLSGGSETVEWLVAGCDAARRQRRELAALVARGVLEQSPIGVGLLGPGMRYRWANRALADLEQGAAGGAGGAGFVTGASAASPVVTRQARQTLLSGQYRVTLEPVAPRADAPPGRPYPGRSRLRAFFPLRDISDRPLGVCYAALDLTGQDPARERLALLNAAGEHIGTTLDLDRTVRELAEVVVPQVADFVAVDLLDVVRARTMPVAWPERGTATLLRAAHLSIQEDEPDRVVDVGEPTRYPPRSPQRRCLATGEPLRVAAVGPATPWIGDDPVRWHKLIRLGVHTHLVVPLRARGVTMGVVTLMRWKNPDSFDDDDLLLVEDLVARAAVCVDNARRYAREHRAALTLQTSLLPPSLPEHSAVEVAHRYLPADAEAGVGGDWFDVIPLSGARVALVVGDVVGHGLHAAASMGRLRAAVQTLADLDLAPDELLARLDDLVVRLSEEAEAADEGPAAVGATCVYAVYDPIARKIAVARAGHPSPVIAHLDEPVEFPDIPAGPPLGLGGLPFECAEVAVEEGSVVALYTDGLIEASDRDVDVGIERLCFTLAHPDRPLEEICDVMVRTLLPDRPRDDVAFLIARTHVLSADRVAYWEVPEDPAAVHVAREDVAAQLARWGLQDMAFSTELIVSELLTNAIRHACGPIGLRLIHERTLICEVSDGASTAPHLRSALSTDEGGRGLFLVAQVALRWGTRYTGGGKTIWAEQPLPGGGG
ncbi:ATP-binding SpoIIE family protein phosphatase [Streptomyces sp. PsTaAH-124]|uniref:ATP-binding SpoIIE family protein phosphatase n=1 Tax=Streptomyces sp. PsTaAH-124 TaxID=1157638 RepID=UPI0003829896|nr:SpoIIE family protein phosphatase [Streptomyces sp. PsTaAH-124]